MRHGLNKLLFLFLIELREFKLTVVHDVSLKAKTSLSVFRSYCLIHIKLTDLSMEADLDSPLYIFLL